MSPSNPSSTSKKRSAGHLDSQEDSSTLKLTKIHPFFSKPTEPSPPSGPFRWQKPLGPNSTCLYGVNLTPTSSTKVAAFDLDGTLIKFEFSNRAARNALDWEWWKTGIPAKLKELHESGYAIVIISNQALKAPALKAWKDKISLIACALPNVPFRLMAATAKDKFRKPMPGMWYELERMFLEESVDIDKSASFFVGDAAGRRYAGRRSDFASTDRKWAINVGIPFLTPEEYFLGRPTHPNFSLEGFHVSTLPDLPLIIPTLSPLLPTPSRQELVLFVGYPCLGKTSFFHRHFQPAGYVHINQDTLKTRDKCAKVALEQLKAGQSCVVDNTNRNAQTRKTYLDLAKQRKIPVRCFVFTGSIELAWHNNLYRAYNLPPSVSASEPKRELVPYMAFTGFRDNYEEPEETEGISEIKRVNWVFSGTTEEKRYWSMWLQIDGK